MHINREIEIFLRDSAMADTTFGRLSVQDPRLVLDMRNGRELRPAMQKRLRQFMAGYRAAQKFAAAA